MTNLAVTADTGTPLEVPVPKKVSFNFAIMTPYLRLFCGGTCLDLLSLRIHLWLFPLPLPFFDGRRTTKKRGETTRLQEPTVELAATLHIEFWKIRTPQGG